MKLTNYYEHLDEIPLTWKYDIQEDTFMLLDAIRKGEIDMIIFNYPDDVRSTLVNFFVNANDNQLHLLTDKLVADNQEYVVVNVSPQAMGIIEFLNANWEEYNLDGYIKNYPFKYSFDEMPFICTIKGIKSRPTAEHFLLEHYNTLLLELMGNANIQYLLDKPILLESDDTLLEFDIDFNPNRESDEDEDEDDWAANQLAEVIDGTTLQTLYVGNAIDLSEDVSCTIEDNGNGNIQHIPTQQVIGIFQSGRIQRFDSRYESMLEDLVGMKLEAIESEIAEFLSSSNPIVTKIVVETKKYIDEQFKYTGNVVVLDMFGSETPIVFKKRLDINTLKTEIFKTYQSFVNDEYRDEDDKFLSICDIYTKVDNERWMVNTLYFDVESMDFSTEDAGSFAIKTDSLITVLKSNDTIERMNIGYGTFHNSIIAKVIKGIK